MCVCARDRRLQLAHAQREAHDCVGELCSMLKVLGEVRGSLSGDSVTPHSRISFGIAGRAKISGFWASVRATCIYSWFGQEERRATVSASSAAC